MASKYDTQELVSALKDSGLTHKEYCSRNGIPASTLAYHLKKHRKNRDTGLENTGRQSFVPVDLKPAGNNRVSTLIIYKGDLSCDELKRFLEPGL